MEWSSPWVIAAVAAGVLTVVGFAIRRPVRRWQYAREARHALRDFKMQRELLEAKFFDLAASQGKPRGLRWIDCQWQDAVTFARDRKSGLLTAFAAVHISFEAIEGGDMEDVPAVGDVRYAAAVFHYQRGRWGTGGRALFNLNPHDALVRLENQFEPVALS
jgi:hypothetical protein